MSTLALSHLPFWRWWRHRRWNIRRRPGAIAKPWNGIVIVGLLIAADQLAKHLLVTQSGMQHVSSTAWLIQAVLMACILPVFALFQPIRIAVLLCVAGGSANALSDLLHGVVANPITVQYGHNLVAFNLADVYLVSGIVMAIVTLATYRPRRQA